MVAARLHSSRRLVSLAAMLRPQSLLPVPLLCLIATLAISACRVLPHELPSSKGAGGSSSSRGATATRSSLEQARQAVAQAQPAITPDGEAASLLRQAEQSAAKGNNPRAQSLARQATASADQALDAQRTREAAAELQKLYDTTGLSDKQLDALRSAEAALIRGDSATALTRLKALRKEASRKTRGYTVQRGETLSEIAEREDVYGNSLLWPLIWQANRKTLPDPNKLRAGQKLVIRVSPTVDEVVQAIRIARNNAGRLSIGEVLEVLP